MGKQEVIEELHKQIKYHYKGMIVHTIGFYICLLFLVGGFFILFTFKTVIPLLIVIGISILSAFLFFNHKNKYQKLKLEKARLS